MSVIPQVTLAPLLLAGAELLLKSSAIQCGGLAVRGRAALFVEVTGLRFVDDDPASNVSETSMAPLTSPIGPPTVEPD